MNSVYLLLGGNIGDVLASFAKAKEQIADHTGTIKAESTVYCTEPWGINSNNMFLNQAILVETKLSPKQLLSSIQAIELKMGRNRKKGIVESRIIDIDILFYNKLAFKNKDIEIPHPRMHLRRFALVPMTELNPDLIHPVFDKTIHQLLEECNDELAVFKIEKITNS